MVYTSTSKTNTLALFTVFVNPNPKPLVLNPNPKEFIKTVSLCQPHINLIRQTQNSPYTRSPRPCRSQVDIRSNPYAWLPNRARAKFAASSPRQALLSSTLPQISGISLRHGQRQRDSAVPVILRTFSWKFWRAPSPANKVGDSLYKENRRVQQTELSFVKLFISEAESAGTTEYLHIKHFQQWKSNAE